MEKRFTHRYYDKVSCKILSARPLDSYSRRTVKLVNQHGRVYTVDNFDFTFDYVPIKTLSQKINSRPRNRFVLRTKKRLQ